MFNPLSAVVVEALHGLPLQGERVEVIPKIGPQWALRRVSGPVVRSPRVAARAESPGELDPERAATERIAIELSDSHVGRRRRGHLDEGEATRPTGVTIGDDFDALDALDLVEQLAKLLGGCAERKAVIMALGAVGTMHTDARAYRN